MTTNYRRGADFERKIVEFWRELDGHFAIRSAGSKTAIDVIAWNDEDVWLIQAKAKRMSGPELEAAKEALRAVPFPGLFRMTPITLFASGLVQTVCAAAHREVWVKSPIRGDTWTRHEA